MPMTSSRLSVVTSKAQKCIRSWASVMMPACRSPRNGTAVCRWLGCGLAADARPASAPALAAPTTAAVTPAAPKSRRRDSPGDGDRSSGELLGGDDTLHLADFL